MLTLGLKRILTNKNAAQLYEKVKTQDAGDHEPMQNKERIDIQPDKVKTQIAGGGQIQSKRDAMILL